MFLNRVVAEITLVEVTTKITNFDVFESQNPLPQTTSSAVGISVQNHDFTKNRKIDVN